MTATNFCLEAVVSFNMKENTCLLFSFTPPVNYVLGASVYMSMCLSLFTITPKVQTDLSEFFSGV